RNSTETTLSLSTSLVVAKHMLRYKHSSFVHEIITGPLSLEKRLRFKHSIIEFKVLGELIVAI
ncbi:hypothetical protein G4B88_029797, partial [Cannabis sativa]